jgi:hypothetical protein
VNAENCILLFFILQLIYVLFPLLTREGVRGWVIKLVRGWGYNLFQSAIIDFTSNSWYHLIYQITFDLTMNALSICIGVQESIYAIFSILIYL